MKEEPMMLMNTREITRIGHDVVEKQDA